MANVVLLHGAFRGPWAWDRVAPRLVDAGHNPLAVDLAGAEATMSLLVDRVRAVLDRFGDEPTGPGRESVVLVAHSHGGLIAQSVLGTAGHGVDAVVYLDAAVRDVGECGFDIRPAGTPAPAVTDGDVIAPRPVSSDASLTEDDAAWINERLVGQAVAPSLDVLAPQSIDAGVVTSYVFFGQTPPGYPCTTVRKRLDQRSTAYVVLDDVGHDGPVTHAGAVAAAILDQLDP